MVAEGFLIRLPDCPPVLRLDWAHLQAGRQWSDHDLLVQRAHHVVTMAHWRVAFAQQQAFCALLGVGSRGIEEARRLGWPLARLRVLEGNLKQPALSGPQHGPADPPPPPLRLEKPEVAVNPVALRLVPPFDAVLPNPFAILF